MLEMKAAAWSVTFFLCVFLPLVGCDQTRGSTQSPHWNLLEGEYLSTTYVDELKKTHSPLKAGSGNRIDLVVVERTDHGFQLDPIFNFHEGGYKYLINSNGSVSPAGTGGAEITNLTAILLDDHTFQFGVDSFSPAHYVFVKKAVEYVSKAVLVGRYKDRYGRGYEFRDDGWAVFPDRKFQFEIGLDHVGEGFDYFLEKKEPKYLKTWAFTWNGDTLEVIKTKEHESGFDEIADPRPALSLRRVQ